jgi:hypothetical protein
MSGRVGEYEPASLIDVEQGCSERQDRVSCLTAVGHIEVQVELLRLRGVWPMGRPEASYSLECVDRAVIDVQGHERRTGGPSWIWPVHLAAEQRAVELCQFTRVRAVDDYALHSSDHGLIVRRGDSNSTHLRD